MVRATLALLHGFLGFSHRGPIEYFRGVKETLRDMQITPLIPEVPTAGTIAERAETLASKLLSGNTSTFALVAHSMGGLDARYLITYLDPDCRIKSLLTVSTPHRGSPLAEWMLESRGPIPAWFRYIGRPALDELTPRACAAMSIPDREDVDYASYAGFRAADELPFWLKPYGCIISGENDGMVPLSSAQWGKFRGIMRADHVELLGWSLSLPDIRSSRPFDHLRFWRRAAVEAIAAAEEKTW